MLYNAPRAASVTCTADGKVSSSRRRNTAREGGSPSLTHSQTLTAPCSPPLLFSCTHTQVWMIDRKRFRYIMNGSGVQTQAARVDNFLKSIDLLSPLTDGQRHTLSQYLTTEKYEDAEYVCEV